MGPDLSISAAMMACKAVVAFMLVSGYVLQGTGRGFCFKFFA